MNAHEAFAKEHNLPVEEVLKFRKLGVRYANMATHESNGDPHRSSPDTDNKNENARCWGKAAKKVASQMTELATNWGFHHLDFGVGYYPTLQKTADDCNGTVHFPYDL